MSGTAVEASPGTSARKAFEHAFYPDTISTDLHRYCVGAPFNVDLLNTMSKLLALGMTLE